MSKQVQVFLPSTGWVNITSDSPADIAVRAILDRPHVRPGATTTIKIEWASGTQHKYRLVEVRDEPAYHVSINATVEPAIRSTAAAFGTLEAVLKNRSYVELVEDGIVEVTEL